MSKVKIKVSVNDDIEKEYNAIYLEKEKLLTYKEEDNTLVKFNYKDNILIRENDSIFMQYKFVNKKTSKNKIFIKDLKQYLDITLFTKNILVKDNIINITYVIEDNLFNYKIEVIKDEYYKKN